MVQKKSMGYHNLHPKPIARNIPIDPKTYYV